ncbi:MAG: TonB-dependent receptor, partial [Gemmatimonadota bacterium]
MRNHARTTGLITSITLLLVAGAPGSGFAQDVTTVSGRVLDADAREPVTGATVSAEVGGRARGVVTDAAGRFSLDLPGGAITLVVTALGFEDRRVDVVAGAASSRDVEIELLTAPLQISGIEVLTAPGRAYDRLPGTATQLSAVQVDQIQPMGTQELLEVVPGIYGAADDGFGNARLSIGIRGLNPRRSSRVLVLEDGIPIQPALYVYPNMYYNPPVDRIRGMEVIKGSAAIRYGPQTMGGVINYITSRPRDTTGGTAQLTFGENGYVSGFAEIGGFGSNGFQPEIQLLAKRGDGFRANNAFHQLNATLKTTIRTGVRSSLFLKANADYEDYEATYTGLTEFSFDNDPTFNPKENDDFLVRRASLDAIYDKRFGAGLSSLTRAYVSVFDRRWWRENDVFIRPSNLDAYRADPTSVPFVSPLDSGDKVRVGNGRDNFGILRTFYAAGVEHAYTWDHGIGGRGAELEIGARLHVERFIDDRVLGDSPTDRDGRYTRPDPDDPDAEVLARNVAAGISAKAQNYETAAIAVFASERIRFGALDVTPGVRFEVFEQERVDRLQGSILDDKTTAVVLPGLGLNYDLGSGALFGGVHRGFTPPSSGTLTVVDFGSGFEDGGLDVEAEKSWNFEAGVRTATSAIAAEVAGFWLEIEDVVAAGRG